MNKLKSMFVYLLSLSFLASCSLGPREFRPPTYTEPPKIEWKVYTDNMHRIPNVGKMQRWLEKVHKVKEIPTPRKITDKDGKVYIGWTPEEFKIVNKILRHGLFGWDVAHDLQKIAEQQQIVVQQVIFMAKLIEEQREIYRGRWVEAENRYLQLEYKVMIDGVWRKITTIGLITGMILIGIAAL